MSQSCPTRQAIVAYAAGRLSAAESEAMEAHLDGCARCQSVLTEVGRSDDSVAGLLRRTTPDRPYENESELWQAVAKLEALARTQSQTAATVAAPEGEPSGGARYAEYRLLEKLGEGGVGRVYKAHHTRLKRTVALKVLHRSGLQHAAAVHRFEREMEAVGQLNHPNIVQAYDARKVRGTYLLVMEFVGGVDVARLLKRFCRLAVADACEIVRQAAIGLQHAHEHGLVHRDIKPSNLMISRNGTVKLLDLGLARLQWRAVDREQSTVQTGTGALPQATRAGDILGTPDYMAPEQVLRAADVDIRADIYGLGCTLYALLVGHPRFAGPAYPNRLAKLDAHLQLPPPPIRQFRPDVPPALASLLHRSLAKLPQHRPSSPAQLARQIAPFAAGANLPALLGRPSPSAGGAPRGTPVAPTSTEPPAPPTATARLPGTWGLRALVPWFGRKRVLLSFSVAIVSMVVLWVLVVRFTAPHQPAVALRPPEKPPARDVRRAPSPAPEPPVGQQPQGPQPPKGVTTPPAFGSVGTALPATPAGVDGAAPGPPQAAPEQQPSLFPPQAPPLPLTAPPAAAGPRDSTIPPGCLKFVNRKTGEVLIGKIIKREPARGQPRSILIQTPDGNQVWIDTEQWELSKLQEMHHQ